MKRVMLTIAYDGTGYCGWQIQPNALTIEEVLNKVIGKMTGEDIQVIGASRTDSGVHALGNVAVFDTDSPIPGEKMYKAINQTLPKDIRIRSSREVPLDFHPRKGKSNKVYEYYVKNTWDILPTEARTHTYVTYPIDVEKMREGAKYLVGIHDFASFCNTKTNAKDTVREVTRLDILEDGEDITFHIEGKGFLYHMVRIIVGTLLRVGRGFYPPEAVKEILEGTDRKLAGATAPAQGLFLIRIDYDGPEQKYGRGEENETVR